MLDTSNWKEFALSELFKIETTKSFDKKNLDFTIDGDCDFVGRSSADNGIQGKMHKLNTEPNNSETFSLVQIGENVAIWRERLWYASQNIFKLTPKVDEIKRVPLFIKAAIDKSMSIYSDGVYTSYPTKKSLFETNILLPATPSGEPDWDFMEQYIAELDAYLKASGLDDYELIEEDNEVLSASPEWGEFRIGDLFGKCNLKKLKKDFDKAKDISKEKTEEFNIPLVNAKHGDNGIMYYGRKEDWETTTLAIDIVNDGAVSTGDVYPQPEETGVLYNAYLIQSKDSITDEKLLFYLAACIKRSIKGKFGYDKKASWDRVAEEYIELPILPDGTPDFKYMEKYIRTIEKMTIRGVVEWKDKEIEKTKEIIA